VFIPRPREILKHTTEDTRTVEQFADAYQVDLDLLIVSTKKVLANSMKNKTKAICHINHMFNMRPPLPLKSTNEFVDRLLSNQSSNAWK